MLCRENIFVGKKGTPEIVRQELVINVQKKITMRMKIKVQMKDSKYANEKKSLNDFN